MIIIIKIITINIIKINIINIQKQRCIVVETPGSTWG